MSIKPDFRQPATLLAIIYGLLSDKENYEKYTKIAIVNGDTAERIIDAVAYFSVSSEDAEE